MARSKYEIKTQKALEAEGWLVDNKAGMARFSKNRDYWHMFDLVAVKKGFPLRFIAVKGESGGYVPLTEALKEFWLPEGCVKELWRYPKTKDRVKKVKIEIIPWC